MDHGAICDGTGRPATGRGYSTRRKQQVHRRETQRHGTQFLVEILNWAVLHVPQKSQKHVTLVALKYLIIRSICTEFKESAFGTCLICEKKPKIQRRTSFRRWGWLTLRAVTLSPFGEDLLGDFQRPALPPGRLCGFWALQDLPKFRNRHH